MISLPTTDQIILDCRRELLDIIGPEVQSEAGKVSVQMVENVLRNAAARAAHEIAWLRDETLAMEAYAADVLASHPSSPGLREALETLSAGPRDSLHLGDMVQVYSLAGEAMSCGLEAAMTAGDSALADRAATLLQSRSATELAIMGEWGFVGRG